MYEKAKEYANAIVNNMIIDDGYGAECLACQSFSEYKEMINHTSSCIVLDAKNFLKDGD